MSVVDGNVLTDLRNRTSKGSSAAGQDAPSTAPTYRFCLSPESLGRVDDKVTTARVDGASCPVYSRDMPVQRKSWYYWYLTEASAHKINTFDPQCPSNFNAMPGTRGFA